MCKPYFCLFYAVVLLLFTLPVHARHDGFDHHGLAHQSHAGSEPVGVEVLAAEAIIIVHGIVCSFCAQGVTRNIARLPFIDGSKYTNGVKVEIEQQKVTIAVHAIQQIDFAALFTAIVKGGYEPVQAYVRDSEGDVYTYQNQPGVR